MKSMKKKSKKSIAIVSLFNWQGIYVNGELKAEGTTISLSDLGRTLGLDMHFHYPGGLPKTKCQKYFDEHSSLPKKLTDTFNK